MTGNAETFLNDARVAELWARFKRELEAKQDRVDGNTATDDEVTEMLDEVFGQSGGGSGREDVAADDEIMEMLDEVFGLAGK